MPVERGSDLNEDRRKLPLGVQGIVVQPGQDPVPSGRSFSLKLWGGETRDRASWLSLEPSPSIPRWGRETLLGDKQPSSNESTGG